MPRRCSCCWSMAQTPTSLWLRGRAQSACAGPAQLLLQHGAQVDWPGSSSENHFPAPCCSLPGRALYATAAGCCSRRMQS